MNTATKDGIDAVKTSHVDTLFQIIMYQKGKIDDFNVLIDGKSFFNLPVKVEEEAYEEIIDMSNNNNYTTGNLLDFAYFIKH